MIERVVAPNPGPMTLGGTNTYLVGVGDGSGELAAIDPGPDDPRHLSAILETSRRLGRISTVLVTHRHLDHLPAALPLCRETGATLVGHADLPGVQRDAVSKLTEYLQHRRARLQQVVDALALRGPLTIEELVEAIYTDVPVSLHPMAARNVRANLEKLASDGQVAALSGQRWRLKA